MKTIAKIALEDGYRDELIKGKNNKYYRIKRYRRGDSYKIYKNNSEYGQPEYDEKIDHLALSRIDIDSDDVVKVNYEKVQTGQDGKKLDILGKI